MNIRTRLTGALIGLLLLPACTFVDATEHCVRTRYGRVVTQKVEPGIAGTFIHDYTCFSMTEQNYPESNDEQFTVSGVTQDRLPVNIALATTWEYNPETVYQVFLDKRDPDRVEVELVKAIREGATAALASFTIDDLIGPRRAELGDRIASTINVKLGNIATIKKVYVSGIGLPKQITDQQLAKVEAIRKRETAVETFRADSVAAFNRQYQAEVDANIKELNAQVYDANPALLQLEIERERAKGLAGVCARSATCILGGSVTDAWMARGGE